MVSQMSQQGRSFAYAYDPDNNNITSVTRTDGLIGSGAATYLTQYVYDGIGQLVRVNDKTDLTAGANGTTWVFAYDRGGNILFKTAYPYATGTVGTAYRTYSFTYDTSWKDKLTKVTENGADKAVSSDACGNITALTLPNGAWSLAWKHGSQLASMTKGSATVSFGYSHTGLRAYKAMTGADTTLYTYNGSLLTHLRKGGNNMHFYYDAAGRPAFVDFNNTRYHYLHNLQGDIAGIVDATGTLVVSYAYDAWGTPTVTGGSLAGTLGALNPFRYRGYVYDDETGLYYLQARYYNPEWGRFISADALMGDVGTLLGHNLFAYCANNPIAFSDMNGHQEIAETPSFIETLRQAFEYFMTAAQADGPLPFGDALGAIGGAGIILSALFVADTVASTVNTDSLTTPQPSVTPRPNATRAPKPTPNPDKKYYLAVAFGGGSPVIVSPALTSDEAYGLLHVANAVSVIQGYLGNKHPAAPTPVAYGVYTSYMADAENLAKRFGLYPRYDLSDGQKFPHFNVTTPGYDKLHFWFFL